MTELQQTGGMKELYKIFTAERKAGLRPGITLEAIAQEK